MQTPKQQPMAASSVAFVEKLPRRQKMRSQNESLKQMLSKHSIHADVF